MPGELSVMLNAHFNEEGLTAADENNEGVVNVNFDMGTRMVSGTPIPVFKGITAQLQEYDRSVDEEDGADTRLERDLIHMGAIKLKRTGQRFLQIFLC